MTRGADDLAAALVELDGVLGHGGVLRDSEDLARYLEPARGAVGAPVPVLRPADVESVREVVRWAKRHRVRLLPQGANSGLVGASTPPPEPQQRLASQAAPPRSFNDHRAAKLLIDRRVDNALPAPVENALDMVASVAELADRRRYGRA